MEEKCPITHYWAFTQLLPPLSTSHNHMQNESRLRKKTLSGVKIIIPFYLPFFRVGICSSYEQRQMAWIQIPAPLFTILRFSSSSISHQENENKNGIYLISAVRMRELHVKHSEQ